MSLAVFCNSEIEVEVDIVLLKALHKLARFLVELYRGISQK
jgi:hypothetical protein